VRGDLLECVSQQISLDIQLGWERKIIWVGEIILVALNVKENEFRVKFEVSADGLEDIPTWSESFVWEFWTIS
jgi:hypothetical protein